MSHTPDVLTALEECVTEDGALCWRDFDTAKRRLEYINNIARLAIAKPCLPTAAPDLLAAAEKVIACGAMPRERHLCGAIRELETAVKKAKGE